jgi:hypothetical protein
MVRRERRGPGWSHSGLKCLIILQQYLTCEGRYTLFSSPATPDCCCTSQVPPLNVPFFSVKKFERDGSSRSKGLVSFGGACFTSALVKILITCALSKKQESWDLFAVKTLARAQPKAKKAKPVPPH